MAYRPALIRPDYTVYVSPSFPNSRPYYSSIQSAINDVTPSLTQVTRIEVLPGTYTETLLMREGCHLNFHRGAIVTYATTAATLTPISGITPTYQGVINVSCVGATTLNTVAGGAFTGNWGIYGFGEFRQTGVIAAGKCIALDNYTTTPGGTGTLTMVATIKPVIEGLKFSSTGGAVVFSDAAVSAAVGELKMIVHDSITYTGAVASQATINVGTIDIADGLRLNIEKCPLIHNAAFSTIVVAAGGSVFAKRSKITSTTGGVCVSISALAADSGFTYGYTYLEDCSLVNAYNNAAGHGILVATTSQLIAKNPTIQTLHASSNSINAGSAMAVRIYGTLNSAYAKHANVTLTTGTESASTSVVAL